MRIGIVGLGLIGGSLARGIKAQGRHQVFGYDTQEDVRLRARLVNAVDGELTPELLPTLDMVILAVYPQGTVDWLKEHAAELRRGTIVLDTCGVKRFVCNQAAELCREHGLLFLGGHPMAGIERSGFEASMGNLFNQASMILVPSEGTPIEILETAKRFFLDLGFGAVKFATAEEHDRIIAYTSQLAHILASAYVQSPTALEHSGFSAGSFRDMTRVATLQERMWTELFLDNQDDLLRELDNVIGNLNAFRKALAEKDADALCLLLRKGREAKARVNALPKTPYSLF